jgi:hypothetical protein
VTKKMLNEVLLAVLMSDLSLISKSLSKRPYKSKNSQRYVSNPDQ